jgi:undecaprenyl diphosphate synthase
MGKLVHGVDIEELKIPRHIAIIMDGNGRWAQEQGLPRLLGHRAGRSPIRRSVEACADVGVEVLSLYAFSTENWERPHEEVQGLMDIYGCSIEEETPELHVNGVQIRFMGDIDGLSPELQERIRASSELTRDNTKLVLNVGLNYGGRAEIVRAVRRLIAAGATVEDITEEAVSRYLYTGDLPDPDLIIRTAGEYRLSNFLIWQAAYSEYWSTPVFWPDFGPEQLMEAIVAYNQRQRKFGRVLTDKE